jgi:hypothetical protein
VRWTRAHPTTRQLFARRATGRVSDPGPEARARSRTHHIFVEIAGVDRDDPGVSRWVARFSGHAVSPEKAAEKILAGVARNRFLIYTSTDIRALYAFKRVAWWPYSMAMRQVNVLFARALRPASAHR